MPSFLLRRIVSGGQTGVDRAALDIAIALGIGCGGWVPRGRRAEDGTIASHYPVRECRSSSYGVRTRLNVRDTDGTLILCRGRPSGGTSLTLAIAASWRGRFGSSIWIIPTNLPVFAHGSPIKG